jgi:enamine deaminase RidA (YjgF/YER057c/UK114 family)
LVEGAARTLYIGGQNGITADGQIAGPDLRAQTEHALRNVLRVLAAAGATQQNVVTLKVHIVTGQLVREAFLAAQDVWGPHATAITTVIVAGLANPQFLVEIDAIAVIGS